MAARTPPTLRFAETVMPGALDEQGRPLQRGSTIGRYLVLDRLGSGGMGVVYAAFDPELNRRVAVKLLKSSSSEGQAWILREAQAMAQLSHPNVIAVYDVGTFGERVFLAMEYVEGQTLRHWLQSPRRVAEVIDVFVEAGRGLAAAHAAGVIHRDFKPDNILVDPEGRVRVMDFGLARADLESPLSTPDDPTPPVINLATSLTHTGMLVGTPAYMAPEQHLRAPADARTDQFSFGVALYEALYGQVPFAGLPDQRDPQVRWVLHQPAAVRVPRRVRRVIQRALQVSPEARYPSLRALLEDLRPRVGSRLPYVVAAGALALSGAVFVSSRVVGEHARLCKGASEELAGIWDAPRQRALAAAFRRTGAPDVERQWAAVQQGLDRYAQDWVAMRTQACVATRIRGEQSDEVLSLRMLCLDRHLNQLKALTDVFAQPDAQMLARAPGAVRALPDLGECADVGSLRSHLGQSVDPVRRAKVEALRKTLDRVQALYHAGKVKEAFALAVPVAERASSLGDQGLLAEVLESKGHMERLFDPPHSVQTLRDAVWAAQAAGEEDVAVRVATRLILMEADLNHHELSELWIRFTGALLDRSDVYQGLRPGWLQAVSYSQFMAGHFSQALEAVNQALDTESKNPRTDPTTLAQAHSLRAVVFTELGRWTEARAEFTRCLALLEPSLGKEHPEIALQLNNIATTYWQEGQDDLALKYDQRARDMLVRLLGADNRNTLNVDVGLAEVALHQGKPQQAYQMLKAVDAKLSPGDRYHDSLLDDLGEAELALGRPAEALRDFQRLRRFQEEAKGLSHPDVGIALTQEATAQLAVGNPGAAIPLLQRALTMEVSPDIAPGKLGDTRFALARALWAARGDASRAASLARQALDSFGAAHDPKGAARVQAWLAVHPGARPHAP